MLAAANTTLNFSTTPGQLALTGIIVAAVTGISWWSWHRSGYARWHGLQELLRVLIVLLIAVLFHQPEVVEETRPDQRPTIAILYDDSRSMETVDAVQPRTRGDAGQTAASAATPDSTQPASAEPTASPAVVSRRDLVQPLIDPNSWQALQQDWNVVIQPISVAGVGEATDLFTPLMRVGEENPLLRGIVLISDGDWNTGRPPVEAATQLRMKGIPVFTLTAGSASRLPDVELTSLDLPTFGITGKAVRVPFTIDSALPREYLTSVVLTASDGSRLTKEVRIAPMSRTTDSILWKPSGDGDFTVTLEIPRHTDEVIPDNNALTAPIVIREEKLRVLIVESYPRWEYRYLRNALSRDPGVELSCLLFHPGLSKPGGGNKDYIQAFPQGKEELGQYDVVFLGDVGVEPGQLTAEDCRLLKGLVEQQASGLVWMPGWQGRHVTLLETELASLCPVVFDETQPGGWGSRTPARLELTERGRTSLLTKLADTPDENVQVWEDLPGFQWYAGVSRARPGSEVLAVHSDASNEYGRLPLLVTRTFGAGKVLFMGTDGAWRWRKGVEDKYHYRFWGQVVRWMAYQRNMAKGESMRLFYSPEQPERGQTVTLTAHVMEASGEPLSQGEVNVRVTAPSGRADTVRLQPTGDDWGVFQGQLAVKEPGAHQVLLSCKQTAAELETRIFVQGDVLELVGKPARPEVLEEIARVTQGEPIHPDEVDRLVPRLAALPQPPPAIRRLHLWSHPLTAAVVVLLLGIFWIWRKALGLI
jgi:hypothetical protein